MLHIDRTTSESSGLFILDESICGKRRWKPSSSLPLRAVSSSILPEQQNALARRGEEKGSEVLGVSPTLSLFFMKCAHDNKFKRERGEWMTLSERWRFKKWQCEVDGQLADMRLRKSRVRFAQRRPTDGRPSKCVFSH